VNQQNLTKIRAAEIEAKIANDKRAEEREIEE
jgi:hypothetical protein